MLRYTGHPYIDVGVATILAFSEKRELAQLTVEDLERIADYMAHHYTVKPLRSFLTVAFPNSGFTQPAYFDDPQKQQIYAEKVLRSFRPGTPTTGETDIFLGAPIPDVAFDVKDQLEHGRVYRQHVPLLTGENVINFFPAGEAGLPISGEGLLAIQAFPLGCARSEGRLLAVHSDNPDVVLHFAASFLESNRKAVELVQGDEKLPPPARTPRTLVIETLLAASVMQRDYRDEERPFSVSVYHLSNSGQEPKLDIYHLPLQLITFLRKMTGANFSVEWGQIVHRAWEVAPPSKTKGPEKRPFEPRRNYLYEDLFRLPLDAPRFLRTYFLRVALKYAKMEKSDPRQGYSLQQETGLVSWKITHEFLRRIMNMDIDRINQIRDMGDSLATYVSTQNDKRFFQEFFRENKYEFFRSRLLRVNLAQVKRGRAPVVQFESYVRVFEEGNELARFDWRLARDLILIRMIERLHAANWFDQNPDAVSDALETDTQENNQ